MLGFLLRALDIFSNGSTGFMRSMVSLGVSGILADAIQSDMDDYYQITNAENEAVLKRIYARQKEVQRMMTAEKKRNK